MEEGNGARSNGIKLVGRCCYVSPRDDETKRRDSVKEKGVVESFLPLTAFHRSRTSVFYIYTHIYIYKCIGSLRIIIRKLIADHRWKKKKRKEKMISIFLMNSF